MPRLTVIIPAYNQIALTRRCLSYLAQQSNQDFSVILQDDASSADYQSLLAEFPDLKIIYSRNEKNLGAIGNMISCLIKPVTTEFIMCLHEDDFLHPEYFKHALSILEQNSEIAFVGSPAHFFEPNEIINLPVSLKSNWRKYPPVDFVKYILNGNKFAFGSIIYRPSFIKPEFIDLKSYDVLFDRPWLLNILLNSQKEAAILEERFYYYQNHPYPDKRWQSLTPENVFNLYAYYEKLAPGAGKKITSQYLFDFVNLEHKNCRDWKNFWQHGQEAGLINWQRISWKFLSASLFIFIFGKRLYYNLFTLIKNCATK